MATSSQVSVTTSAGALVASGSPESRASEGRRFLLKTASSVVYVGGSGVTSSTGYLLTANVEYPVDLRDNETLYAVTSSGSATVYVWGP